MFKPQKRIHAEDLPSGAEQLALQQPAEIVIGGNQRRESFNKTAQPFDRRQGALQRIAHTLLDLCKEPDAMTHPDGMQIKVTRQELGKIVGCSREMAGRVLKNLEQDGLVSVSGKTMVVFGTR